MQQRLRQAPHQKVKRELQQVLEQRRTNRRMMRMFQTRTTLKSQQ
jgi:hypothetical protein